MESKSEKNIANVNMELMGINTCVYQPEANKQGLPQYDKENIANTTISGEGKHFASALVLPWSLGDKSDWQVVLSEAFTARSAQQIESQHNEQEQLEAILQAIVEHGQEMLPLLSVLRNKAEFNEHLATILKTLQERLNLGINAACSLTPREMEVLEYAAVGARNSQIAEKLDLHVVTVTKTLTRAYRKLDAKNRAEAVHKWMILRGARG